MLTLYTHSPHFICRLTGAAISVDRKIGRDSALILKDWLVEDTSVPMEVPHLL